jgi:hypothetical protein
MEITFERDLLYQEVWATPLTKLAKKYGLSDNGIRKVCKALDIPLPERGHWARIAAGHTVLTPPLSPGNGKTRFVSRRTSGENLAAKNVEDDTWLKECKVFESSPANAIRVPQEMEKPHALVVKTMRALKEYRVALEKSRKRAEAPPKPKARWQPDPFAFVKPRWSDYLQNGVIELAGDVLPLKVSLDTADRALRIWDALIKACVCRDMTVSIGKNRLLLGLEGETVEMRISEGVERVAGSTAGLSEPEIVLNRHIKKVPTGELRIFVCDHLHETKCADAPGKPLELQMNALLCRVYGRVASERAWRARLAEQSRLRAIAEARREAEHQAREERRRHLEEERRREAELIAEASVWDKCNMVQAYIKHISQIIDRDPNADRANGAIKAWLDWASRVVQRMDPTSNRMCMVKMCG